MPLVVSLTSIPPRFKDIGPALESLLAQTADIEEIRLHIPHRYRRFPDYDGALPDVPRGIRIVRPEEDLGPASKAVFAAHDLRGTDTDIIYCDDDRLYPPELFKKMLAARSGREDLCVTVSYNHLSFLGFELTNAAKPRARKMPRPPRHWAHLLKRKLRQQLTGVTDPKPEAAHLVLQSGYTDIAEGLGGVLIRPDFFDDTVMDIPPVIWAVDDIWLSGHLARRNIPIWCERGFEAPKKTAADKSDALADAVIEGADRRMANRTCVKYMQDTYGVWL